MIEHDNVDDARRPNLLVLDQGMLPLVRRQEAVA